jgi:hypothetical protein
MLQAFLLLEIVFSLLSRSFAKSIIRTNRVIPLLAVLFDGLACLTGVALFIVARFDLLYSRSDPKATKKKPPHHNTN